jgi:phenylacetate-CoA ligase
MQLTALSREIERQFNPQQIRSQLDRGVAATVAFAREHSPYYRRMLADAPVVRNISDLRLLPLTTKHHVSELNEEFWCVDRARIADVSTTSGTTGAPTLYPQTLGDLERLGYNEYLSFAAAGLSAGDLVLLAVTIDKCFMAGLAYFEGLRKLGVTAVRVGAGSPAMLLSMTQRLRPTAIVSVPSFLKRIAAYAEHQGVDLSKLTVRKLICIGESVRDVQWKPTPMGSHLEQVWGAQIYSTYGVTELASSLCECGAGRGGHLHPELLHVEIVDGDGRSLPDGQEGHLVATTIGVEAMPLVRFDTGDVTFMTHERCACGLLTPRIGPILGRKSQAMKIKGTTVYPAAVQRALECMPQLTDYIMIATTGAGTHTDELEVVVAWQGDVGGAQEAIREKLRGNLKVCPNVRLASVEEIQSLGHSAEFRKQRVFLDRRKHAADNLGGGPH